MTETVRVVPAILTDKPQDLKTMLEQAKTYTDYVQIDIMDGRFVPSHSITWEHIAEIRPSVKWEAHLMIENPAAQFANYQKAGAQKVIFHYEAATEPDTIINAARGLKLAVGIAVNPETTISRILPLTDRIDSVLFLSVHPGFYGAQFIPEVVNKIVELRRARPNLNLGIDGGIKENNIAPIARSGVNEIFVGSAILLQPDPGESFRRLTAIARQTAV
jgi:ribulose-phosphate 3-epimerase